MTLIALGSGELDGAGDEQFSICLHNTCLQVSMSLRTACTHEMSLEVALGSIQWARRSGQGEVRWWTYDVPHQ